MQQWHPDRWTRTPSLLSEAKCKFQKIQEAYSGIVLEFQDLWFFVPFARNDVVIELCFFFGAVLSDPKKRNMYDAGLYDPREEEDEVIKWLREFFLKIVSCLFNSLLYYHGSEGHVLFLILGIF